LERRRYRFEGFGISGTDRRKRADRVFFRVGVIATVVIDVIGVEKFKEDNMVDEAEVERESRRAESISLISFTDIWFTKASDRPLKVTSNINTKDTCEQ